jgi:hypothetical protein
MSYMEDLLFSCWLLLEYLIRTTSLLWVMIIPDCPADWLPVVAVALTPKYGTRHHFRIIEWEVLEVSRAIRWMT